MPEVLLSGDHARIERWRRQQALLRTAQRRPDLFSRLSLDHDDVAALEEVGFGPLPKEESGQFKVSGADRRTSIARRTYVALVHHPVYDRKGDQVATAVTNLDLHDIARACRTYGLAGYFVVTPVERQQELVRRIRTHWTNGYGAESHFKRREALELVILARSLDEVSAEVAEGHSGLRPIVVATSARRRDLPVVSVRALLRQPELSTCPMILVFGTGWGLAVELLENADFCLNPIEGLDNYNHLSVRSAVSIYLDRLFGRR